MNLTLFQNFDIVFSERLNLFVTNCYLWRIWSLHIVTVFKKEKNECDYLRNLVRTSAAPRPATRPRTGNGD